MSSLAELYARSWHREPLADGLERFLSRHPDLNIEQLVEVMIVDQSLQWQTGLGPRVEQYRQRFPAVANQPQALIELVCGEMRAALALGVRVDVEAYVARFPDLAEPLSKQMEVWSWLVDAENGNHSGTTS